LMQRIGRVNRIGSVADKIYNYMFYPSAQGNKEIHLYSNSLIKLQGFHSAFGEDAQIYSREEIVKEFQMFNPNVQDAVDRSLRLLEEARALYRSNRKLYNKIKALPMKSRTVRETAAVLAMKHDIKLSEKDLLHSTIVYLSSPQKVEYYWVRENGEVLSIPFLDAMDILKAGFDEKPDYLEKVMDFHYEQVKRALQSYQKVVSKVMDADSIANRKEDKATHAVLGILRSMKRTLNAIHEENAEKCVEQVKKLEKIVELGVFSGLNTGINSFQRFIKKQKPSSEEIMSLTIEKVNELYERYNIPLDTDEERSEEILEPQIVVSETFL